MTAERTVEVFQEEMSQVRKMVRDSETKRHEGLAPLRWVASLTVSNLSYDPSFPIEGGFSCLGLRSRRCWGLLLCCESFS